MDNNGTINLGGFCLSETPHMTSSKENGCQINSWNWWKKVHKCFWQKNPKCVDVIYGSPLMWPNHGLFTNNPHLPLPKHLCVRAKPHHKFWWRVGPPKTAFGVSKRQSVASFRAAATVRWLSEVDSENGTESDINMALLPCTTYTECNFVFL